MHSKSLPGLQLSMAPLFLQDKIQALSVAETCILLPARLSGLITSTLGPGLMYQDAMLSPLSFHLGIFSVSSQDFTSSKEL